MKRAIYTLSVFIVLLVPVLLLSQDQTASQIRLAVVSFDDSLTAASEKEGGGDNAASMIEALFKSIERFYVRDRGAVKSYISALEKVQAGAMNPESMKGDPASLKIDYLTVGTVSKVNGRYEIDARTVSVDNMIIVHSHGASSPSLNDAVEDISWYIKEKFNREYVKERQAADEERPTVTVFRFRDFNDRAGKAGYGGSFAEILNSQMGSFLSISTIERKYSKALINEKILEMAGVIENDESGKNFRDRGIQYKVEGDIRVFSDMITLNYRVYNTSDNSLVYIGSRDIGSSKGLRPAAWSISNTIEDVLNNRIGVLKVTTVPAGADIYIDGKLEGKGPAQISVMSGKHILGVKLDGYIPYKGEIDIQTRAIAEKSVTLREVPYRMLQNAMDYERKKDWNGAVKAYTDFIKEYSDTREADSAYYRKGHIEMMYLKRYKEALATFEALVKRYPDTIIRAEGYYGIMRAYEFVGNREKAYETRNYILSYYGETNAAEEAKKLNY
ncbi:MAG TPA: PEGA domain-containing protein [Spirochaetota bacterium]|nr:PEGA domain-containing protein [Spirochaetota bacterium]HPJ33382.1 PEGA domain-containing protein [Spirochaetota bacterium]